MTNYLPSGVIQPLNAAGINTNALGVAPGTTPPAWLTAAKNNAKAASTVTPSADTASNNSTATTGATTGTTGSGYNDPVAAAYYGGVVSQLKGILGTLPEQETEGRTNITNNANLSLDRANQGLSEAESKIATQRQQENKNKVISLNNIDQNVANTVNSFRRLIAAGHTGNSSFANDFVPMATARQGSQQRQNVNLSYGNDMAGLDTADKQANLDYNNNVTDIKNKENSDLLDFLTGLASTRDALNQQAAQAAYYQQEVSGGSNGASAAAAIAPFQTDTASRLAAMKALFSKYNNPTYAVNPVQVTLPDVSKYTQDPLTAQLSYENPSTPVSYLPYLPIIKKPSNSIVTPSNS